MTESAKEAVSRFVDAALKIAVALILAFSTYTVTALADVKAGIAVLEERIKAVQTRVSDLDTIEERIRLIEANRFTARDGQELWKEIAEMKGRLPDSFPPDEWKRRWTDLEERLHELEIRGKKD